jgi:16S rRNA (adenine1518-N6/adenine1519-N6)-dimethyltransferase
MLPEHIHNLLKHYHIQPKKIFGQNFLLHEVIMQDTIEAADVQAGDWVLEVGPGICTLTRTLLEHGAYVLAVEKDTVFQPVLRELKKDYPDSFHYEFSDILSFDFVKALQEWSGNKQVSYKIVANIPYYITGKFIRSVFAAMHKPISITLLVQKEVAHNITAKPGRLSLLGLSAQLYADCRLEFLVPAHMFYPKPKVDSAVITMHVLPAPRITVDEKRFFAMLKACFAGKRKQLHNPLSSFLHIEKTAAAEMLTALNIDPKSRPQDLSLDDWYKLYAQISKQNY